MFFLRILAFIFLSVFASGANLPLDEVESLRVIARTLGKTDWNFSVDPCGGLSGWATPNATKGFINASTCGCNCTFVNNTVCHVVSIVLKAQNLTGTVPREIVRLPFLQEIDLTRNYLNGTIPSEWGSMKLVNISLLGNRVTGQIPRELANISTLTNLFVSSNNLTGELPESLGMLTTLKDFRISDNNFTGRIPNFIQNWTNIEKIAMQASGLTGPIPTGIASLTKLTDLRICDLNGNESTFPPLSGLKNLTNLILRSCKIVGWLPPYVGNMTNLKILDLSFNGLSGPIPDTFAGISSTDYIYLTGNFLTGPLPTWMRKDGEWIDLSYNNLTFGNTNCEPRNLNLFASSKGNTRVTTYGEDRSSGGPSNFFSNSGSNWAFSNTGHFLDDNLDTDSLINSTNSNIIDQNPQLYTDARLSPISLTYYGFCLRNGNYTVKLHFAEIMFTSDRTYSSLGRRIFDVYIQGERVLKDFNIEEEAGGVNRAITRNFIVVVTDTTLDIRFYWAGKGTTAIPVRGVYGPLISAISVDPDFKPPSENGTKIPAGLLIWILAGVLFTVFLVMGILWWKGCLRREKTLEDDLRGVDLQIGSFTLRQIKAATHNFDRANKIGEGSFGPVYKGLLSDGTIIAVKQLSSKSKQGNREFINEIGMISALQHPHLVKLYGCCIDGNQLLLIYEYMENNSLARALFSPEEHQLNMDWPTRRKICIGIARGLAYLHEESRIKIVHRDIKATNVLLDKNFVPKISDFGLAKLDEEDNTHISTRIAGTLGYMAPEYALRGYLTDKADVYSFGVVLLEVVSGRSNTNIRLNLLDWANSLKENGDLMELVDPRLESKFKKEEVLTTIKVALHCTNVVAAERPLMSAVVSILEGKTGVQGFVSNSSVSIDKTKRKEIQTEESQSISMDMPCTGSSISTGDLYPIILDTEYWENRDL
ncbi:hypothetical protein ACJIZ3_021270 [Penstemon smallii]|uniref:non-specific serine/threonine protein kinase n=1 Tax=Penstemon smallii TaxID=265156 RepID=A0ABD3SLH9_9LAMI